MISDLFMNYGFCKIKEILTKMLLEFKVDLIAIDLIWLLLFIDAL